MPFKLKSLKSPGVWAPRPWSKSHPDSGSGDPSKATAEKGRRYLDVLSEEVAGVLVELSAATKGDLPYV
jgi:creatinine amidohydrolase